MDKSQQQTVVSPQTPQETKKKIWKNILVWLGVGIVVFFGIWFIISKYETAKEEAAQEAYHKEFKENELFIGQAEGCSKVVCLIEDNAGEEMYSEKFIPEELVARSAAETAIIVRLKESRILKGTYGSNSYGYQYTYSMKWYDARIDETVQTKTFYGGQPPSVVNSRGNHYGSKPDADEVTAWIQNTYESFFEAPYTNNVIGNFHLVVPPVFMEVEDGFYQYSKTKIEIASFSKATIGIYGMEEFLPKCSMVLGEIDGLSALSEVKYSQKNNPYYIYRWKETIKITDSIELSYKDEYNMIGVFVVYETKDVFYAVDFYCSESEFSSVDEAIGKFVKWSELCFVSEQSVNTESQI